MNYQSPVTRSASLEAAEAIEPVAATQRERIFKAIRAAGERGLTDAEMQDQLHLSGNTQRPRRIELCAEGRIVASGFRRSGSGRKVTVWVVVQ